MTTAVKVDDDAKSRLEELLSRLIDDAYGSKDDVIESFRESTVPLTKAEKERMRQGRFNSGVETDEEEIDEILYE